MLHLEKYVRAPKILVELGAPLRVSFFIHMPANDTIVLFRKRGHILSVDELLQLEKIEVDRLFAPRGEYLEAIQELSEKLSSKEAKFFATSVLKRLTTAPRNSEEPSWKITGEILDETAKIFIDLINELGSARDTQRSIRELLEHRAREGQLALAAHGRQVAALSALILVILGNFYDNDFADIVMAGLAHDTEPEHLRPDKEQIQEALQLLTDLELPVSDAVRVMVMNHHENLNGTGLFGLKASDLSPSARILRIADDLVCHLQHRGESCTLREAIARLEEGNRDSSGPCFDASILKNLSELLSGAKTA